MNIHAVGNQGSLSLIQGLAKGHDKKETAPFAPEPVDEIPGEGSSDAPDEVGDGAPVNVVEPPDDPEDEGEGSGVLRLLESGHFRGVSDVRLRINFHDQLVQRASAAAAPVIEEQTQALASTISEKLNELAGELEVDEETLEAIAGLISDFEEATESSSPDGRSEGSFDLSALTGSLESAFESLVTSLTELLASDSSDEVGILEEPGDGEVGVIDGPNEGTIEAPEEPVEGDVGEVDEPADGTNTPNEEPAPEPELSLEDAIAALRESFDEALAALSDSINSIESDTQLPELSEPNGNGVAFDKFLSIYNQLLGGEPNVDDVA